MPEARLQLLFSPLNVHGILIKLKGNSLFHRHIYAMKIAIFPVMKKKERQK